MRDGRSRYRQNRHAVTAPELWLACLAVLAGGAVGFFAAWAARALGAPAQISSAISLLTLVCVFCGWVFVNLRWWVIEWRERSDG